MVIQVHLMKNYAPMSKLITNNDVCCGVNITKSHTDRSSVFIYLKNNSDFPCFFSKRFPKISNPLISSSIPAVILSTTSAHRRVPERI